MAKMDDDVRYLIGDMHLRVMQLACQLEEAQQEIEDLKAKLPPEPAPETDKTATPPSDV